MSDRSIVSAVCLTLSLICLSSDLIAQRQMGIRWSAPGDITSANRELNVFSELGISHLEVNTRLPSPVWARIGELGFKVYGVLPVQFPLTHTYAEPDSAFLEMLVNRISHYSAQGTVQAIGLFQYGPVQYPRFARALQPYVQQIRETYDRNLYYLARRSDPVVTDTLFDFKMVGLNAENYNEIPGNKSGIVFYYNPADEIRSYLTPVKTFLEETSEATTPVFFDSEWILNILNDQPGFESTLKLYSSDPNPVFATPNEQLPASSPHSPVVLLLILIWGVFAVNYTLSPVFRKSLFRYFIGHKFYVEDIMQRHIRTMVPAGIMLLQHAILTGIAVYCLLSAAFSDLGIQALSFHMPVTFLGGGFTVSVAVGACLVALIIEAIGVLWLLLANPRMKQLAQVINLYAWPMQINLFIVTGMVTLLMAGYGTLMISILGILFLIIFLSAFVVTSFDSAKYVRNRHLYLAGTSILYSVAWVILLVWLFTYTLLPEVYGLALELS